MIHSELLRVRRSPHGRGRASGKPQRRATLLPANRDTEKNNTRALKGLHNTQVPTNVTMRMPSINKIQRLSQSICGISQL
jgi:hypothetical protein